MIVLDKLWEESSKLSDDYDIDLYQGEIALVKNIFKNPELVLKFQKLLSVWESVGSAKPGLMSLKMPSWTSCHIADELFDWDYIEDKTESEYIYFYDGNTTKWNDKPDNVVTNQCYLPHVDSDRAGYEIIGLVNLNQKNVRTGFWSYMGEMKPDEELVDEYYDYSNDVTEKNYKDKINNGILNHEFDVEYGFNDAIFYHSRLLHQPHIDNFYTRENPRIMFRTCYTLDEDDDCDV